MAMEKHVALSSSATVQTDIRALVQRELIGMRDSSMTIIEPFFAVWIRALARR